MSENEKATVEGTVEEVIFSNPENGYAVCLVACGDEPVTIVGTLPFLGEGEYIRAAGTWQQHPSFGRQLKVETYEKTLPKDEESIFRYLSSGAVKGVGPVTATRIIEKFGADALDVIEHHPDWLCDIKGVTKKRAEEISECFRSQFGMREVLIFCREFFGAALSVKIYRRYGAGAVDLIRANPYRLCDDVPGVGFDKADRVAMSVGFAPDCDERLEAGVKYVLQQCAFQNGHCYFPARPLAEEAARVLGCTAGAAGEAIRRLVDAGKLTAPEYGEEEAVSLPEYYNAERLITERLAALSQAEPLVRLEGVEEETAYLEEKYGFEYDEQQKRAIRLAVSGGVTVVTGGPGTGKTTVIKAITDIFLKLKISFALTAPTGRAAKRMSETCGQEAKTVHRLLETTFNDRGEQRFARDRENPLPYRAVIVDEMSMVDSLLFASLLDALKPETYLILIGDADQLPPVGAGNVLADMIESGRFGVARLEKIFRQAQESLIITNAHRINAGELPVLDVKDNDFFFLRTSAAAQTRELLVSLCRDRLPKSYGVSPEDDIQIISPTRKGELGTFELNRHLQQALNPPDGKKREKKYGAVVFREGDKIMQTRNNYDVEWHKDGTQGSGVFNGDMGRILKIAPGGELMTLSFDGRIAEYDAALLEDVEHAYAVTVHKSQGSEYPMVLIPVFACPYPLMTRNLLYTAVTRAKDMVILAGSTDCIRTMVRNDRKALRYTHLRHMLAR